MITVIKPLTLVHEPVDSLHKCTLQQMKLVLATIIHNYRTIWRKNTQSGSCCPSQLTQTRVTKFSFTCPANFPVLACFYSKWWCMHKICFACNFGNTHEMNKILICIICSTVFMSQCSIHSLEKSMNFLQVHRVLWISETNIKYYTALKKTWEYKKNRDQCLLNSKLVN